MNVFCRNSHLYVLYHHCAAMQFLIETLIIYVVVSPSIPMTYFFIVSDQQNISPDIKCQKSRQDASGPHCKNLSPTYSRRGVHTNEMRHLDTLALILASFFFVSEFSYLSHKYMGTQHHQNFLRESHHNLPIHDLVIIKNGTFNFSDIISLKFLNVKLEEFLPTLPTNTKTIFQFFVKQVVKSVTKILE